MQPSVGQPFWRKAFLAACETGPGALLQSRTAPHGLLCKCASVLKGPRVGPGEVVPSHELCRPFLPSSIILSVSFPSFWSSELNGGSGVEASTVEPVTVEGPGWFHGEM